MKVWGAASINLKRQIDDIYGREDSGDVVFQDADPTTFHIYMPISITDLSIVNCRLAEEFIKHCGISEPKYQQLVLQILIIPITEIEKLLEPYDLDRPNDDPSSNIPNDLTTGLTTEEQISDPEPLNLGTTSALQASIPTLNHSMARVREAAASRGENTSFSVHSARAQQMNTEAVDEDDCDSDSDQHEDSGFVDSVSGQHSTQASGNPHDGSQNSTEEDAFGVESLRSALPDIATPRTFAPRSSGGRRNLGPKRKHLGTMAVFIKKALFKVYTTGTLGSWVKYLYLSPATTDANRKSYRSIDRRVSVDEACRLE